MMKSVLHNLCDKYPDLAGCIPDIEAAVTLLDVSFRNGGKLLLCGNGGSAADCEHIVGELMKGFMSKRSLPDNLKQRLRSFFPDEGDILYDNLQGALPAISLVSHSALFTAYANDVSAEMVFAQQVYGYGRTGDVLLGLTTSGNSPNIIRAMQVAKATGVKTIALTGRAGGRVKLLCDVCIRVPYDSTPDIQERHLPIYHAICMMLEEAFFS